VASTCCVGTPHCQGTISYYNPTSRHLAIDMCPAVHTEATFVGLYGALFLVMLPLLYTSWYAVHLTTASAGESCAHVLMSRACFYALWNRQAHVHVATVLPLWRCVGAG